VITSFYGLEECNLVMAGTIITYWTEFNAFQKPLKYTTAHQQSLYNWSSINLSKHILSNVKQNLLKEQSCKSATHILQCRRFNCYSCNPDKHANLILDP
jgi:hypothetical protein